MFAVPGWAVSPASLVQETKSTNSRHPPSTDEPSSTSKKRKSTATHRPQASKVSGIDLERLWSQRNDPGAVDDLRVADPKRERTTRNPDAKQNAVAVATAGVADISKRKSKREKKGEDEAPHKALGQRLGKTVQHDSGKKYGKDASKDQNAKTASPEISSRSVTASDLPVLPTATKLTPLQAKMRSKLTSARFRHLNETLYTTSSSAAMDLFTASPDLFAEYHAGFSQQVKDSWPKNPVDQYIQTVKARGHAGETKRPANPGTVGPVPLPRRKTGSCTIADMGCGDAPLARGCQSQIKNLKLKFHNYDLHAANSLVTKADISNLPLRDGEADIAVFCLSLMGTNWLSFVEEAWRILRGDGKGEVWVAEVKSRFGRVARGPGHVVENSVGKRRKTPKPKKNDADDQLGGEELFIEDSEAAAADETNISAFVQAFSRRGFVLREDTVDKSNKMFVTMVFVKSGVPTAGKHKGLKWNGYEYQKLPDGKMMGFGEQGGRGREADEVSPEDEAKVLKPCVYKNR